MMMTTPRVICAMLAMAGPDASTDRPPALAFDRRVDYIAWCNAFTSRGRRDNALPIYERLYLPTSKKPCIPSPMTEAARAEYEQIGFGYWSTAENPAFAAYLDSYRPVFDVLKEASVRDDFWFPYPKDARRVVDIQIPILRLSREATRMRVMYVWRQRPLNLEDLLDAYRVTLHTAGHMQQQGSLIGGLVGIAERAVVFSNTLYALSDGALEGDASVKVYAVLHSEDPGPADWQSMLNFEWAAELDMMQSSCPSDADFAKYWKPLLAPDTFAELDPRRAARLIDRSHVKMKEVVRGPINHRTLAEFRELIGTLEKERSESAYIANRDMGTFVRAYELVVRSESQHRAAMVALALYDYHGKRHEWPKDLESLRRASSLEGLDTYLIDPFSAQPFRYRLVDGAPQLYTIGADGVDDGGRHDVKWGERDNGGDYIYLPFQK